jgi:hypothetical protein
MTLREAFRNRRPGGRRFLPILLAGVVVGCASSPPPARARVEAGAPSAVGPSPVPSVASDLLAQRVEALHRSDPGAAEALVGLAFDRAEEPGFPPRWVEAVEGYELVLFSLALGRAAGEARAIEPILRELAADLGRQGSDGVRLSVVREIAHRECCVRRSYLAAALAGLADGLDGAVEAPGPQAEAAARLEELASNRDAEVAEAAARVARCFPGPR